MIVSPNILGKSDQAIHSISCDLMAGWEKLRSKSNAAEFGKVKFYETALSDSMKGRLMNRQSVKCWLIRWNGVQWNSIWWNVQCPLYIQWEACLLNGSVRKEALLETNRHTDKNIAKSRTNPKATRQCAVLQLVGFCHKNSTSGNNRKKKNKPEGQYWAPTVIHKLSTCHPTLDASSNV